MKFLSASVFSIIAAISAVSAWEITIYEAESNCEETPGQRFRNLVSQTPPNTNCLTFGQDFPGVDCVEYEDPGAEYVCGGSFTTRSILLQPGVRCEIYSTPFCGQGTKIDSLGQGHDGKCSAFEKFAPIGSIKCS
ncbi:hypothetical protein FSARC_10793 [Fusarium sarcochroum]|uniref:Uncharacterized protein n=1 Tax=Fusarium sarcochroum TaxID=1208366 RepID=A0A8H4TKA9_9HYPO|nr:hypothetical protein FSARC_10793 [Fusarium sarcochroum]